MRDSVGDWFRRAAEELVRAGDFYTVIFTYLCISDQDADL